MFYYYDDVEQCAMLYVKIKPRSNKNSICSPILLNHKWFLVIKIKAVPSHGEANDELVKFLASTLKIKNSSIVIINGHFSKFKILKLKNLSHDYLKLQFKYYI